MTNNPTIDGVSLLPCPFCGSKELSVRYHSPQANWIQCDKCDSESPAFDSKPVLLTHWNTRADAPAVERQELGDPAGSFDKHMEYMQENIRLHSTIARLEAQIAELESKNK